jgi:hypothetical protein
MNEADASSIAYCGLHCGDCPNHSGEIADLARDLRKKLREYHFERVAPGLATFFKPFANYEPCYKTLGAMGKLRCKRGCRNNGGPPQCKIRNCCRKHDFQGAGNALILRPARSSVSSRRRTETLTRRTLGRSTSDGLMRFLREKGIGEC